MVNRPPMASVCQGGIATIHFGRRSCPALRHRGSLSIQFNRMMTFHAAEINTRDHPDTVSESAIQCCLTLNVLFGLARDQDHNDLTVQVCVGGPAIYRAPDRIFH